MLEKFFKRFEVQAYFIFRVFVGLLFFQHGLQKMFGIFTTNPPVELLSLMGLAGVIELVGGAAIALGFFTRLAALGGIIDMIGAYFIGHFGRGAVPIQNGGELALLYLAAFLIVGVYGAKRWSLEKAVLKKEVF